MKRHDGYERVNKLDTDYAMTRKNLKKAKRAYRKALRSRSKKIVKEERNKI